MRKLSIEKVWIIFWLIVCVLTFVITVGCSGDGAPPVEEKKIAWSCLVNVFWTLPTEYEDETPLVPEDIVAMVVAIDTRAYHVNPHSLMAQIVTDWVPDQIYATVTAANGGTSSRSSAIAGKCYEGVL